MRAVWAGRLYGASRGERQEARARGAKERGGRPQGLRHDNALHVWSRTSQRLVGDEAQLQETMENTLGTSAERMTRRNVEGGQHCADEQERGA